MEFAPIVIDAFIKPYPQKEENNPMIVFTKLRPLLDQHLLPINKPVDRKKEKYVPTYHHAS